MTFSFIGWYSSFLRKQESSIFDVINNEKSLNLGLRNVQGKVKLHGDYIRVDVFGFEHQDAVRPLLDNLQAKLLKKGLDPRIPWLNNHRICFRFM